jgi:hypothetical protein
MVSNAKVVNKKVVEIIEVYNFCFGPFSIQVRLGNSKFEFPNMRTLKRILG